MTQSRAELLRDIVETAKRVLSRPVAFVERPRVTNLFEQVRTAIAVPCDRNEGERVIDEPTGWLLMALKRVIDEPKNKRWRTLALFLLEVIEEDVQRAYELELEQMRQRA